MSDKKARSRTWLWYMSIPVFVLVVYPLSTIPVALISNQLVSRGIVSRSAVERVVSGVYAPILGIPAIINPLRNVIRKTAPLMPGSRR
jgi:hypothetical protein